MPAVLDTAVPAALPTGRPLVTLRKSGNLLEVSTDGKGPPPEPVKRLLEQELFYQKVKLLYGPDRRDPVSGVMRNVATFPKQLYRFDSHGRMVCGFGFLKRVIRRIQEVGFGVRYINKDPERKRPRCFEADIERVRKHFTFKPRQEECLRAIIDNPGGLVWAITGFGKMAMIAMVCLAFPHAKIHVITRSGQLVEKLVDYLTRYISNVGQVGYGKHYWGQQVTVLTAGSLHHARDVNWDADFILCDEAHQLLADNSADWLKWYRWARAFAFTASPRGRLDGTDVRMEGLFGDTIFYISYPEGVNLGLVVPIRVEWSDVHLDDNPCANMDGIRKKRWGIWRNYARNRVIAAKARTFGDDEQVQILVDTIEHAVNLWQHLPEFLMIYAPNEADRLKEYKDSGMVPADMPVLTATMIDHLRSEFEQGRIKKVITTGVWATGIDPQQLTALVRADAASSEIADIQYPGRVSRTHRASGKEFGIVCDFRDQFDTGMYWKARKRYSHYREMGWDQVVVQTDGTVVPLR